MLKFIEKTVIKEALLKDERLIKNNIRIDDIYIHSTTIEGLYDLFSGNKKDYLSVSTLENSTVFIDKDFDRTLYVILEAKEKDVDFKSWGDVGWKGGSPSKTTYDEVGLKNWKIKGFLIPSYKSSNLKAHITSVIANNWVVSELNNGIELPIITNNSALLSKAEDMIQSAWDKTFGSREPDDYAMIKFYKKLL